ncbi:C2 calcium-dependent domain-containing protein 4C-like [Channa argus]|uniref:C2 calcium-dependent domain-containing protein 4C-like n=1 Tax=Channa argus TaxID=215402 RepID=UPI002944C737|nr:hypothetical protein Q8A73_000026 [Channa argus]
MSAATSGKSLRNLVLTPERIPDFLIPSRSTLKLLSPRSRRSSPERTRLLSDHDHDSLEASPPKTTFSPAASPRFRLRLLPQRIKTPRAAAVESADADTDLTTRAAMSLPHVQKVTTPYGFRAVLVASPCTRRRESLFHRNKPATQVQQDLGQEDRTHSPPAPSPTRSRLSLRSIKAVRLQVMKELKRPAAALKARSPGSRRTVTR